MPSAHRRIVAAALFFSTAVFAAGPQRQLDPQAGAPTVVTGGTTAVGVRFTAPSQVAQMKVEILSPEGQTVYDSAWRNANVLDWSLADNAGHPLASGAYRARVTVKYLDGGFAVRQAMVRITGDRVSFEPAENGDSIVVEEEPGEARSMMLLAHDGQSGAVVATQGDLAFKFGDFVRAKEIELMRLTADGKLGIGTDHPQATLDVVGTIRASQGVEFSDGTVQTSGLSGRVDAEGNIMPMVAGTGTVNQVAKWLETGGAGTLGDTAITESGGSVTVGTVASRGQLQIAGPATADVFAGMGPDLINGPAFNYGYAGFTFGLGAGFFNVRPAAGATGVNPSLRFMTINQERMIVTNAGNVGIGTSAPAAKLHVVGNLDLTGTGNITAAGSAALSGNLTLPASSATAGALLQGGSRLLHTFGSSNVFLGFNAGNFTMTGGSNTASGASALVNNTTGNHNTASGRSALANNTAGFFNTASGSSALFNNTTGSNNTASGVSALVTNTTGSSNTASGVNALQSNTTGGSNTATGANALLSNEIGGANVAIGASALQSNTEGSNNVAIGPQALTANTIGSNNIAVGGNAGFNHTTESNNIDIGSLGVAGEAGTIRIGRDGFQTKAFLVGVSGVTSASGVQVFINTDGQLGTTTSSAGVKRDIAGLGEQSSALMKLRPVSFFYRSDAAGIRQYGLIAEEVAEVMPELVQFTPEGEAQTVRYHFLAPLLLSEIQKHQQTIEQQRQTIEHHRKQLAELRKEKDEQITMIEARLATLEEQSRLTANLEQSVAVQQRITEPSGRASE